MVTSAIFLKLLLPTAPMLCGQQHGERQEDSGSRQDGKPLKIADGWRNYSTQRWGVQRS